jgi:hypothetical protein
LLSPPRPETFAGHHAFFCAHPSADLQQGSGHGISRYTLSMYALSPLGETEYFSIAQKHSLRSRARDETRLPGSTKDFRV